MVNRYLLILRRSPQFGSPCHSAFGQGYNITSLHPPLFPTSHGGAGSNLLSCRPPLLIGCYHIHYWRSCRDTTWDRETTSMGHKLWRPHDYLKMAIENTSASMHDSLVERTAGGPGGDIFEILLVCFPYLLIALSLHLVYYGVGGINLILQYSSGDCNFLLCGSHRP